MRLCCRFGCFLFSLNFVFVCLFVCANEPKLLSVHMKRQREVKRRREVEIRVVNLMELEEPVQEGRKAPQVLRAEQMRQALVEKCVEGVQTFVMDPLELGLKWKIADIRLLIAALKRMGPSLEKLFLSPQGCSRSLTSSVTDELCGMPQLRELDLRDAPLGPAAVLAINAMKSLVLLRLGGIAAYVHDQQLTADATLRLSCSSLEELSLDHTAIDDGALAHTCRVCTRLTTLNLSSSQNISDIRPLSALTSLQILNLINCEKIEDISPLRSLVALVYLNVQRVPGVCGHVTKCKLLSLFFLTSTLLQLPVLPLCEHLVLDVTAVAPPDFEALSSYSKLTTLSFNATRGVTSPGIALLTKLPLLRDVCLNGSCGNTDAMVDVLAKSRLSLFDLDLCNSNVSRKAVKRFQKAKPECQVSTMNCFEK
jgi:hypothetical protein